MSAPTGLVVHDSAEMTSPAASWLSLDDGSMAKSLRRRRRRRCQVAGQEPSPYSASWTDEWKRRAEERACDNNDRNTAFSSLLRFYREVRSRRIDQRFRVRRMRLVIFLDTGTKIEATRFESATLTFRQPQAVVPTAQQTRQRRDRQWDLMVCGIPLKRHGSRTAKSCLGWECRAHMSDTDAESAGP